MFSDEQLSILYDCATTSKRLPSEFADQDLPTVIRYGELFKACHASNSSECILKSEDVEEKTQLERIVSAKLKEVEEEKRKKEVFDWNVNIVIGNSHVAKSLRPNITIRMPDGKLLEFDIDSFAQFRQQLARTVIAVNPQE